MNSKKADVKPETYEPNPRSFSFDPLLMTLREKTALDWQSDSDSRDSFESVVEQHIPNYDEAERRILEVYSEADEMHTSLRPLGRERGSQIRDSSPRSSRTTIILTLLAAKGSLQHRTLRRLILNRALSYERNHTLEPLQIPRMSPAINQRVLETLHAVQTTPYECSFLSRLAGLYSSKQSGVIAVDWETRTPWMELMADIRAHHALAHPEREQAGEAEAPITYRILHPSHLSQVHDLLARVFWEGIDVSDALDHVPEKCTIVALYKELVVGAAFLSSPQETYITYLAVRAGWDNSQIATSMLYHLISHHPKKDITLHVSINNPAMLLYNRFGFKAEEFIVGFYEDYLHPDSPQSKNAFRLRLRR
ncbi:hypothetical protein BD414DRAFT_503629 [Trametes punicea]|nr:hypothetical protein BD414DRAFT_503629 [Trametes punicea]